MFAGKIATSSGHAAWVSSAESRQRVFKTRAESDAIVVGGNTVRRDSKSFIPSLIFTCGMQYSS